MFLSGEPPLKKGNTLDEHILGIRGFKMNVMMNFTNVYN